MPNEIKVTVGSTIYGFMDANKQPQCELKIRISVPNIFYYDNASSFLKEAFGIDSPNKNINFDYVESGISSGFKNYISAAAEIARSLLLFGSFPFFDKSVVTGIVYENGVNRHAAVSILVPVDRYQNRHLLLNAFSLGFQISQAFIKPRVNHAELLRRIDQPLKQFVEIVKQNTQGGVSTRYILWEAYKSGLPILFSPAGQFQVGLGKNKYVFLRSATQNDSAIGALLTKDKYTCIEHLKTAGIPTPNSQRIKDLEQAKSAAIGIGFPVVMKPADRDRGEGVVMDIMTDAEVVSAFEQIQKLSSNIIIEDRVPGVCHRLLVFQDELAFAFTRHPLSVVGDGFSNVTSLIQRAFDNEEKKVSYLRGKRTLLNSESLSMLKSQGISPETVLKDGQIVYLKAYQSPQSGIHTEIVTQSVHPANAELACRAARLFGLEVAGIDIISTDITKPWYQNHAVVNEVNFQPQIGDNTARFMLKKIFSDTKGEIPIQCFVGDDEAMQAACQELLSECRLRTNTYLTSHKVTIGPDRTEIYLNGLDTLFERVEFLLRDPKVERLIVVIQTNEFDHFGLPFYRISDLKIINESILNAFGSKEFPLNRKGKMIDFLRKARERSKD